MRRSERRGGWQRLIRERAFGVSPFEVVVDYPLEQINEAFADQDAGRVTRASLVTA